MIKPSKFKVIYYNVNNEQRYIIIRSKANINTTNVDYILTESYHLNIIVLDYILKYNPYVVQLGKFTPTTSSSEVYSKIIGINNLYNNNDKIYVYKNNISDVKYTISILQNPNKPKQTIIESYNFKLTILLEIIVKYGINNVLLTQHLPTIKQFFKERLTIDITKTLLKTLVNKKKLEESNKKIDFVITECKIQDASVSLYANYNLDWKAFFNIIFCNYFTGRQRKKINSSYLV